ncbi:MAG: TolC family protein [Thermoanaerobaculia bacterium]
MTFSQPLLRNLGKMATNRNITIARTNYSISRENFERQVTGIILLVEEAYWNLAEAEAQLGVAEESLELALQLHEQNKIRVEVGTLAPLELVQSEAGVANRELEIIRAQARVGDRMDVLRQLLNLKSDLEWTAPIDPTTDPFLPALKVNVDASIATALEERPEVRAKKLSLSNQELDTRYFRNQKKPRLDLTATYGLNGLGGDVTDRDFLSGEILGTQDGDYGDAIDQILNADFDGWRVALNFAYPIQNRFAKANVAIADLALERGMYELDDLELAVSTEVRRVIRALDASAEGIESARVSQRLEERNYEAEKKRYDNGMSTSFQVLQIQEDLIGARSVFVSAVATYRRALALHYQSIGRLIDESGVEIVGE